MGLGWNATIGPDTIAEHILPEYWGWNARDASPKYIAIEFSQPTVDHPISDRQVRTAAWYIRERIWPAWGELKSLVMHSELPAGVRDGKTDAYPAGSAQGADLKGRLLKLLSG